MSQSSSSLLMTTPLRSEAIRAIIAALSIQNTGSWRASHIVIWHFLIARRISSTISGRHAILLFLTRQLRKAQFPLLTFLSCVKVKQPSASCRSFPNPSQDSSPKSSSAYLPAWQVNWHRLSLLSVRWRPRNGNVPRKKKPSWSMPASCETWRLLSRSRFHSCQGQHRNFPASRWGGAASRQHM